MNTYAALVRFHLSTPVDRILQIGIEGAYTDAGCGEKETAENVGKKIDTTIEPAKDAMHDAESAKDAIHNATK